MGVLSGGGMVGGSFVGGFFVMDPKKNTCTPYVVGVESHMFFTEAASFSYAPYILGVATPIPFYLQKLVFHYTVFSVGFIQCFDLETFRYRLIWNRFT